jgi:hypothetical protein
VKEAQPDAEYHHLMSSVFISYRREDTAPHAGRIYDRLKDHFGGDHVFFDVDALRPGQDFVQALEETLAACDVVVAVIGRGWCSCVDEHGNRRLDSERDYVRLEIATAINRSIPIFPVLVGGATMPHVEELPEPLASLARRGAIEIHDARFHQGVDELVGAIGSVSKCSRGARLALRAEPATLSTEEVGVMLVGYNFFCARLNEGGAGIDNRFEPTIAGNSVVVVDRATGLMWQKRGSGQGIQGNAGATAYVQKANDQALAGFADWRLPTLEEAMSVNAVQKHGDYHLAPVFDRSSAPFIWTADIPSDERRWMVYYADGCCATEKLGFHAYIRLVRSASQP